MSSRFVAVAAATLVAAMVAAPPGHAFNYVSDSNGIWWGIQDAAPPRVDTGSIRATQVGPGQNGAYSSTINGFGGIKVWVPSNPRFNGELLRGFGLRFDGAGHFTTTQAVPLGGVDVTRDVLIQTDDPAGIASYGRWLDTFRNTTAQTLTIKVAFGGESGYGASGSNSSAPVNASDGWAEVATPLSGSTQVGGPQATVYGARDFTGSWLYDSFNDPYTPAGHDGNFQAYVNTLTLAPGQAKSVLHFVVLGRRVTSTTSAAERTRVEATASTLAATPDLTGLSPAQVCSIANFSGLACTTTDPIPAIPAPAPQPATTSSPYDVVGKTIGRLQADMEAGRTTSRQITRAYLDRIAAYDQGQFGFNAFEIVASDALQQAKAADDARAAGRTGRLLGIPIGVKNLFDTKDMATTNGSLTFAAFQPAKDAFQVARLRAAGAVIIGKTALEEYATSGNYSDDAWGQVWNAFSPSRSAIASSGGSATATALSFDAAALGSQTGDSLYGPASGASLVSLRGTDGLESSTGVMPLSFLTDFGGVIARSVPDLADMLDAVAGTDPDDPSTAPADAHLPADWRDSLSVDALRGKRIGFIPAAFVDPFGTTGTTAAEIAAFRYFTAAGATVVTIGSTAGGTDSPPNVPDNTGVSSNALSQEGWDEYIDAHPELQAQGFAIHNAVDVACSQKKIAFTRQDPSTCSAAPTPRLTAAQLAAARALRVSRQQALAGWMDAAGVDAIVYPGLLSDITLNDGGGSKASFGRRDTPSATYGSPTVIFPAGYNDHGQPIDLQLLGRAWSDPQLVGMAYAFEHYADADGNGHEEPATAPRLPFATSTTGTVGGSVPATLSLTLGGAASFGAFTPGVTKDHSASTTADVISTAGDAALSVSDPGHLTNGAFALPSPLVVDMAPASWSAPVSHAVVTIGFHQRIGAGDALRTGTYTRTLTFTLSTTSP